MGCKEGSIKVLKIVNEVIVIGAAIAMVVLTLLTHNQLKFDTST